MWKYTEIGVHLSYMQFAASHSILITIAITGLINIHRQKYEICPYTLASSPIHTNIRQFSRQEKKNNIKDPKTTTNDAKISSRSKMCDYTNYNRECYENISVLLATNICRPNMQFFELQDSPAITTTTIAALNSFHIY